MVHWRRRLGGAVLAAALIFSGAPKGSAYTDTQGTWAGEVIEKAGAYGLMTGYPDGRFGVGESITRAEFVTVLCRMFGWELVSPGSGSYTDSVPGEWYFSAVETAAAHDVWDRGGAFRPDESIGRSEMAQMLVRALGYRDLAQSMAQAELPFSDVAGDRGYVAVAYHLGIINGMEEDGQWKFKPGAPAPREQAAAMLVRCYERYTSKTDWLHGFYAVNSYSQLSYTDGMEAVSVGWARLEADGGQPVLNDTSANGNGWVKPTGAELVTGHLQERSIPCNLSVFATAATLEALSGAQAETVEALVAAARPYAGLTVDFEGMKAGQKESFTALMTALRAALPADQSLYVCVPPDTWYDGFDYRTLGQLCDKVILMAHDYQWSSIPEYYLGTQKTNCPVTPLDKIYTALQHVTDPATGVQDRSKLALAISFNTTGFHVDETGALLDTTFYHPSSATIAKRLQQSDTVRTWDAASRNPYITYTTEDGGHYKLWYEDAQSVGEKLQLARMFGITGVSVWRLGVIPDYDAIPNYNVWQVFSGR